MCQTRPAVPSSRRAPWAGLTAASLLYAALALYLFGPYGRDLHPSRYALAVWPVVAAAGAFVLSRRWISASLGSFLAGAVYGFGPFVLHFVDYHAVAGIVPALLPWLFCPAAFYRPRRPGAICAGLAAMGLAALPFLFVIAFFQACAAGSFYPVRLEERITPAMLTGLLVPLTRQPVSVYHAPLVILTVGLTLHVLARRTGPLVVVLLGVLLALCPPLLECSPIVWMTIPMLYAAVLVGLGAQAMAWSGPHDTSGVILCTVLGVVLAGCTYGLGLQYLPRAIYHDAAVLYGSTAVLGGAILVLSRSGARWHGLRWALLVLVLGSDILLGARSILAGTLRP